jgi:hypothetical protein
VWPISFGLPRLRGPVAANFTSVIQAVVWFLSARLASPKPYIREDGKAAQAPRVTRKRIYLNG